MTGRAAWLVALGLSACNDKADDTAAGPDPQASVAITSPGDGAFVDEGDPVTLSAVAKDAGGAVITIDSATWTAGAWTTTGNDVTVTDLPAGALDLTVEAEAAGQTLTDAIVLYVYAVTDDTGTDDTGAR